MYKKYEVTISERDRRRLDGLMGMLYGKGASKGERDTAKKAAITILAKAGLTIDDWIVDVVTPQQFFFGGYAKDLEPFFAKNFSMVMGNNCKYERVYNPNTNIVYFYFEGTAEQKKTLLEKAKMILDSYDGYRKIVGNNRELAKYYTFVDYVRGGQIGSIENMDKETQFKILDGIFAGCKDRKERMDKLCQVLSNQSPFNNDYVIERMKQIDPYIRVIRNRTGSYCILSKEKIWGAE